MFHYDQCSSLIQGPDQKHNSCIFASIPTRGPKSSHFDIIRVKANPQVFTLARIAENMAKNKNSPKKTLILAMKTLSIKPK